MERSDWLTRGKTQAGLKSPPENLPALSSLLRYLVFCEIIIVSNESRHPVIELE